MDHTSTGAAPVKTGKADRRADLPFLVITLTLLGVGVVMVLSASFASAYYDLQGETGHNPVYFFSRQAIFAAAGVCVMLIASRIPMRVYRACALPLLLVSIASLAAVLVIGTVVNGARRWISLGFTTFQPSEITKIAIILYFSALICKYKDRMRTFRYGIAPFAAILAVVSALLVLEPHFSATIIILAIGASMLFLGGVRLHWFIGAAGVLLVGAVAAVLGCYSQMSPDAVQKLGADIVYGTADRLKLVDAVEKAVSTGEGDRMLDKPFDRRVFEELPAGAVSGHTRALLKIQD